MEHPQESPFVKRAMQEKKLNLHGWVYDDMSNGEIKIVKTGRPQKS